MDSKGMLKGFIDAPLNYDILSWRGKVFESPPGSSREQVIGF